MKRGLLYLALLALYLLHNDFWWWDDPRLVAGLPVGLGYHLIFCLVVAAVLALVVRYAPPPALRGNGGEGAATRGAERGRR